MPIHPQRIHCRRQAIDPDGHFVLYWMQQAQRAEDNQALDFALALAAERGLPIRVLFALTDSFPEANLRHYAFMLEGLDDVRRTLVDRHIPFALRLGNPPALVVEAARQAVALVMDRGYLRVQRQWRSAVLAAVDCQVFEVEAEVVVPVELASDRAEIAARTLRPKIWRHLAALVGEAPGADELPPPGPPAADSDWPGLAGTPPAMLANLPHLDRSVPPAPGWQAGTAAAKQRLREFLAKRLADYAERRNQPGEDLGSGLSPYLHFGQISPAYVVRQVQAAASVPEAARAAFLEELVVRRELAINHCHFNDRYDQFAGLPTWAQASLDAHADDPRPTLYSPNQLEQAQTEDPYWNAAQREMLVSGHMHGYMRMYWGKRLLEWHATPQEAFATAIRLNNRYQLDGRDPNGFVGVAWCFGLHDHPWPERPIFGTVRCMKPSGLQRKFDMTAYLARVAALGQQ